MIISHEIRICHWMYLHRKDYNYDVTRKHSSRIHTSHISSSGVGRGVCPTLPPIDADLGADPSKCIPQKEEPLSLEADALEADPLEADPFP